MTRLPSPAAAALSLLLGAGCSLVPRYERPTAPIPAQWDVDAGGAAGPSDVPARGWRAVLKDPRLQALVVLALENNRDLRVAMLNVELARAQYGIERAPRLPSVGATAGATRQHLGEQTSPTGAPMTTTAWTVGLGITAFELDFFGRVRSLSDAALEQYLATEEARRAAHLSLVAEVATQYLTVRALDDQVELARRTYEAVESSSGLARRTFEAGRTSELDVRTAEAQLLTARFNLSSARLQRDRAQNALVLLVGGAPPANLPPPQPLDSQELLSDLPAGVPSEVLLRRPDILAAEHALQAANAVIGAARAAFFPSISLTGFRGSSSGELDGLFGAGSGIWSFAPQIRLCGSRSRWPGTSGRSRWPSGRLPTRSWRGRRSTSSSRRSAPGSRPSSVGTSCRSCATPRGSIATSAYSRHSATSSPRSRSSSSRGSPGSRIWWRSTARSAEAGSRGDDAPADAGWRRAC
jgi:multidrug efflux system outer membrane protein